MAKEKSSKTVTQYNRLHNEKSPYLLQHAANPVDWYAWGQEAFEKAAREDKPIFLSIGYSTCHWCHVMAHESFEDPEVARLLNDAFVCIKVDREERPDIDSVYMFVCQMMTQSGGWPLTIIMTPDKKPFFAATYIPKETRFGRKGMLALIPEIKEIWQTRRDEIIRSADQITGVLQQATRLETGTDLDKSILATTYKRLESAFDSEHGGFSRTPKFPTPHNLLFLLRYWKRSGDEKALSMVTKTLQEMRRGGIYDQIGYGFHRYSTDPYWLVPHFEKMLYDQALLAMAYTEAYQATGDQDFSRTAREIFSYVLRDMTDEAGGFYSAEDADSEGEEGKFYVWTQAEIKKALPDKEAELIIEIYNVTSAGNFAEEATGVRTGANILHLSKPLKEYAKDLHVPETELEKRLEAARQKLFAFRVKRVHPHKDDKILTDWNGLMIAALAQGARVLDEPTFTEAAKKAAAFILNNLRRDSGRLLHRYRDGEAAIAAHSDDYAFLVAGLLELYETTFETGYLETALNLNNHFIEYFWDEKQGGFYSTADDAEELLLRQKEIYDGAVPSGNSIATLNLLRLARITGNADLEAKAARIEQVFSKSVQQVPAAHTQLMLAVDFGAGPSYEVVITGKPQGRDTRQMLKALRRQYIPNKVVIFRPAGEAVPAIARIAAFTEFQTDIDGKATAYVCRNFNCKNPTTSIAEMLKLLSAK